MSRRKGTAQTNKQLITCIYSACFCCLLLSSTVFCEEYNELCNRIPKDTTASKTPGDNGFRLKLAGRPPPEKYVPNQVYTISLNGTYPNQKLLEFMLVAVPLNARDETTVMGTFQHLNQGVTKFHAQCTHLVTNTYRHPKSGVEVLWTAPGAGAGCIEFRATVVEYADIWYKDDGALTRVFCEDTGTTENNRPPELLPECCACGSAKYMMTFHGLWSRQTHPKDYPTHKRLLHWSNIVGASHAKDYMVWQYGDYASKGVKEVCEFGYTRTVENEMRKHSNDVRTVIKTSGIWWKDPIGLRDSRWARFSVDKKNHLLSMLSMLGPSPDWCVGISAMDLCMSNCSWAGDMTLDLYPWDAGTDDGVTYMSPNSPSRPQQKIHKITESFPENANSPFYGVAPMQPLARLEIKRVSPKPGSIEQCNEEDDIEEEEGFGDNDDDLTEMELKKKLMMMNQEKCGTADWGDWSECSVTCGVGMRVRKRMFLNPMVDENMCPGFELMEKENCIGFENTCEDPDEECSATEWSEWSPCSVTCGKGIHERRRYYMRRVSQGTCNREMAQTDMCFAEIFDCNKALMMKNFTAICSEPKLTGVCRGSFQRWYFDTQMKKCLPFTYGGCRGNNNRFMTMDECNEMCGGVRDSLTDAGTPKKEKPRKKPSKRPPPNQRPPGAIDCMVTPWTEWSECSETCGKSFKYKNRMIKREAENGGKACPTRLRKRQKCDVPDCPDEARQDGNKVDCMVTEWTSWSDCTATCGEAVKTRRRMIKREPENGGQKCPKKLNRERTCKLKPCVSITTANPFTVYREEYTHGNFRTVSVKEVRQQVPTKQPQQQEPSNRWAPSDCQMDGWSTWSPCPPSTCVQERTRPVIRREQPGGRMCGPRLQRRHCSEEECYRQMRARIPNYGNRNR